MMSRFKLYTKGKKSYQYLAIALVLAMWAGVVGYGIHIIGTARAKSRETVLIHTEEEFEQYLIDRESEEYNLNGRYQLEENLDLSWLEYSVGTNIEPFTGNFDGNGHVISGLTRPLFGVMKRAEIENLFLSDADIVQPFTYSNGEYYVDGYAALAAYAVDSRIQNCGMGGRITTSVPVETEYQTAKASPSDAGEMSGPGAIDPIESVPSGENSAETSGTEAADETGGEAGPDNGAGNGSGAGSDGGPGTGDETGSSVETEIDGPGAETEESAKEETDGTTAGSDVQETGDSTQDSESTASKPDTGEETAAPPESSAGGVVPDPTEGTAGDPVENTDHSTAGSEAETGEAGSGIVDKETKTETREESVPASEVSTGSASPKTETPVQQEIKGAGIPNETVGYQQVNRPSLKMKLSTMADINADEVNNASPSNATPASAEEGPGAGMMNDGSEVPEESPDMGPETEEEYIGNPYGDIYLLVTADQITVGGLVAETAGETLISDSFVLVTVEDSLDEMESWSGGMTGILGTETRVENSYTAGLLDSRGVTGGFAAVNEGEIQNCYSTVAIGEKGAIRGAFTASGNGRLSGCVYDRQMACTDAEVKTAAEILPSSPSDAANAEFSLIGLDTSSLTGIGANIPGTWYQTENAYPQLEAFAQSENKIAASNSRASVIALMLPEGVMLSDVLKDSTIMLPSSVDGDEIQWNVEGDADIDENNQIKIGVNAGVSRHEAPTVGTALQLENTEVTGEEQTEEDQIQDQQMPDREAVSEHVDSSNIHLKATVGAATRNFTLNAASPSAEINYANWGAVGEAIYNGAETGTDFKPALSADGYYEIKTPEALAWFGYMVNHVTGSENINGRLMNDIDLSGSANSWTTTLPLEWIPIGESTSRAYTGIFDGGKYTICNLKINNTADGVFAGLFGYIGNATLKDIVLSQVDIQADSAGGIVAFAQGYSYLITGCGVESGTIEGVFGSAGILFQGKDNTNGTVSDCYNKARIKTSDGGKGRVAGGIVGRINYGYLTIVRCYNLGDVWSSPSYFDCHAAGICPYAFWELTIDSCYNAGTITGYSTENKFSGGIGAEISVGGGGAKITNSYNLSGMGVYTSNNGKQLSEKTLKSWAVAYALNGQSMEGVWAYKPGEYPGFGTLTRPDSWREVGQGVIDGVITSVNLVKDSTTGDYNIGSAEQLAAFAVRVNTGTADTLTGNVSLIMDINLAGERYGGTIASPIPWYPIGDDSHVYKGTFDGGGKNVGYMRVERDGYAGLFGCAGGGAVITGVGIDSSCKVTSTGTTAGDGTAALVGLVKCDDTAVTQITIRNCYSRATVTSAGAAFATGAFVGNFIGVPGGSEKIANCYNTGTIAASGGAAGAIAGTFSHGTGGGIENCYWDSDTSGSISAVVIAGGATEKNCGGKTTAVMKSDGTGGLIDLLNTDISTGTWYRVDKRNDGYPIFMKSESEVTWADVGAAVTAPRSKNSSSLPGTADDPYLIWTAEELAWFAYQVNHVDGNDGLCAEVKADINLYGGLYSGHAYEGEGTANLFDKALLWIPIGSGNGVTDISYTGTFHGNGHIISVMRAGTTGSEKQGLFGTVGDGASISGIKMSNNQINVVKYGGGIAGYVSGVGVSITECENIGTLAGGLPGGVCIGGIVGTVTGSGVSITKCGNTGTLTLAGGENVGGIVGRVENNGSLVIDGCFNGPGGKIECPTSLWVAGILGSIYESYEDVIVRNCYNRGTVEGTKWVGGITGILRVSNQAVSGCYNAGLVNGSGAKSIVVLNGNGENVTNCYYVDASGYPADTQAQGVPAATLSTWGAAWALNGRTLSQDTGISWDYDSSKNDGYPHPTSDSPQGAGSWENVMRGVVNGLVDITKPTGSPYQISTAEQLAWFAYEVNNVTGKSEIQADLTGDIDMQEAESKYVSSGRLAWVPIGKTEPLAFQGVFGEGNQKIYEIQNLYVNADFRAGLFGEISGNAKVMNTGVSGCSVSGTGTGGSPAMAGGIAGRLRGNAVISHSYNRGGSTVTANGETSAYAGGIAGLMNDKSVIEDCYHLDSTVVSLGSSNDVSTGGITGSLSRGLGEEPKVRNSYNACGAGGSITSSDSQRIGGITGWTNVGGESSVKACYSEELLVQDEKYDVTELGTTDAERQSNVNGLNTTASGKRTGTARVWYTSLNSEETRGLPTFTAPETVAVEFVPDTPEAGSQVLLPGNLSVAGMKLRSFGAVDSTFTPGSTAATGDGITLTACTDLTGADSHYHKYGYTDANQKLAFKVGGKDLLGLAGSLTAPVADLGTVNSVSLGRAAAYTKPEDRYVLLEGASGTDRYEIQITVKGVTSKTLSVTMPVEVAMAQLTPDGTDHVDYSVALNIKNNNAYPIDGKIVRAVPRSGNGYVPLKPVVGTLPKNREITDASGGVRLGLANQLGSSTPLAANIYYDPDAVASGKSWLEYRLKHGGILPYRYVMEYSGLHFSGAEDRFAYDISYGFAVSESNYTDTADVTVTP